MVFRLKIFLFLLLTSTAVFSQSIPISMKNEALYEFVDELAASRYITVNQLIKPYTQAQVKSWLQDAESFYEQMTPRQQKEWQFYVENVIWEKEDTTLSNRIDLIQRDYGAISLMPVGLYNSRDNFHLALKPILNAQFLNNTTGTYYHRSIGLALDMQVKNWSFYSNLQDYSENEPWAKADYLVNQTGGNYKATDYSDMRGGLVYTNDWASVGLVKDYIEWGTNQNGANIISDRAPSFAQLKLKLTPVDWFEFNYVHGWLVSNIVDSARSYTLENAVQRDVLHGKYIAANMFTIYPVKSLALSAGNSIVYSAEKAKLQYLNPLMFYKSVDHTYNSTDGAGRNVGQNSQMFFDLSFRGIKNCFFYYTLFVDELKMERWKSKDEHNFYSYKAGVKLTQLLPNVSFGFEYTHTTPITYQHDVLTTTFESNDYNLGHYLRDNAEEYYAYVHYRPLKNLRLKLSYTYARKGEEYGYDRSTSEAVVTLLSYPFIEVEKSVYSNLEFLSEYQIAYDLFINVRVAYSDVSGDDVGIYYPSPLQGRHLNIMFGANLGF